MRLKQLLGIVLLASATHALAAGSVSQLSGVEVQGQINSSVVTILAGGAFTHTEYRPTDSLMLVDLAGVSVGSQDASLHTVSSPGVRSYRILGYRSTAGGDVARIELSLAPGSDVAVTKVKGGLQLSVTGAAGVAGVNETQPASKPAVASPLVKTSHIKDISVARSDDGLNIEIIGSGSMTAKTMKLKGPDRVVVDIPNSVLDRRLREILVNSNGVKGVRAGRYQSNPPATRVVLDMATMHDVEIVPGANKLTVHLLGKDGANNAQQPARRPAPSATIVAAVSAAPNTNVITDAAVPAKSQPIAELAPVTADITAEKATAAPQTRAEKAAAHFTNNATVLPPTNEPPFPASASLATKPAAMNAALLQQTSTLPANQPSGATTGCTSGRYTGDPVGFNVKDMDLKDFFRVIHEISGLNVILDPAVKGSVTTVLDDVPWDQALAIVLRDHGLECELQGNVLRIVTLETLRTEADARRLQLEAQEKAIPKERYTRYLSYAQAKDAALIVKKFLTTRGDVVADARSNALIIEDIPAKLPKIDQLLQELDRKTPQVEIEARVVATTRHFARDIGTQMGFGYGYSNSAVGGALADGPTKATLPPGFLPTFIQGSTAGTIPLFSNLGATGPTSAFQFLNLTPSFRLDAILSMAEDRGLGKVLSRPRIVTQNNVAALIRQGQRVPVVTQAQLGGPPTVQYVDAFLRLTVTPQITAESTIFLTIDVENTTADFTHLAAGQVNPTLNTQQATTQVLITDGGTIVIGGVIQTNNQIAIQQIPLLGSVPILGNLFKHTSVKTDTQELIFFITPKIIQT